MTLAVSVSARKGHGLGKSVSLFISLIEGQGVAGDAHCGVTMKHRSRAAQFPDMPNTRQVHLIGNELLDELAGNGFRVSPGELGENILTRGVDLAALPTGTVLAFPSGAVVRLTGLRNPCRQLERHTPGLMNALIERAANGTLVRKGGVMGIVMRGGDIQAGDGFAVNLPISPHVPLQPV
jgi:hypothetical protein